MFAIDCPTCPHRIVLADIDDRPPPWCPRCGGDLKPRAVPVIPESARQLWNERPAPTAAVTATPAASASLVADIPPPPAHTETTNPPPLLHGDEAWAPKPPAQKPPIPVWAGLFAFACAIIPFLTMGGAIPGAIGFGGASCCITVARNSQLDIAARVSICFLITLGCWGGLFMLFGGMAWFARF